VFISETKTAFVLHLGEGKK